MQGGLLHKSLERDCLILDVCSTLFFWFCALGGGLFSASCCVFRHVFDKSS